jgi:hypothetical protein
MRERRENPHANYQEKFSLEEMERLEQEFNNSLEADKASAAAALERAQAMRAWEEAEHARLRPLFVKLNGGYNSVDLLLDAE